jgi:6-phospho-beta-glucosidase
MLRVAEAVLGANSGEVFLGYFGLNHLGWIRSINFKGQDQISQIIDQILKGDRIPGLPFEPSLIATLGLIPNEYLYFYYYTATAVQNILQTGKSRGEQVHALNQDLFNLLLTHFQNGDLESMHFVYQRYLDERSDTYMVSETSQRHNFNNLDPILAQSLTGEGYARVALNLMESLLGIQSREMIINIPNGAI